MGANFTTPVGRLVMGSLYKGNDKDADGNPLLVKHGPNQGKSRLDYFFGLAVAKAGETHWSQTEWGQKILGVGAADFPQAYQSPKFAWKIMDGDSAVPNGKGKAPNQREGCPGHWILMISSGYPPNLYRWDAQAKAAVPFPDPDAIKLGYFVQVNVQCDGNGSQQQPGIYLNHRMVCFSGHGPEIVVGPDVAAAGFGQAPLPPGASALPIGAPAGALVPPTPLIPGLAAPAPLVPALAAPVAPMPAGLVPVPGAAHSIEALRAQSWTDDQIVAGGYATRPGAAIGVAPLPPGFSVPAPAAPAAPIAPVGVVPNAGFVMPPPATAAPAAPAVVMNPGAPGTLEQFLAQNWTVDQVIAAGHARYA